MHFGIACEHSHAAALNSSITPVDSEKIFVVKDIGKFHYGSNENTREAHTRSLRGLAAVFHIVRNMP